MTGEMAALGGLVLALLVAAGVWFFARKGRPLVGGPPVPPAPLGERAAAGGAAPAGDAFEDEAGSDLDDGFDYAPALRPAPAVSAGTRGDAFEQTFEWQRLRHDLERLENKLEEQQRVIVALQAEVDGLREKSPAGLAPRSVSPEYDAALVYARQGQDAAAIAERCGITLAEAELVCAMATK